MADNKVLEEKVHDFLGDQVSKKFAVVMEALEKAMVYVPGIPPVTMTKEIIARIKAGENVPMSAKVQPTPFLMRKQDGNNVLPVFTSMEHVPEDKKAPIYMCVPYSTCVIWFMNNQDKIQEICLNPHTEGLTITKDVIEVAYNRIKRNVERERQIQAAHDMEKQQVDNVTAASSETSQSKTVQMTEKEFKKLINKRAAQTMFPMFFFEDPVLALEQLLAQKEAFLAEMYATLYPSKDKCNYTKEDFSVLPMTVSDSLQIIRIDLPEVKPVTDTVLRVYLASDPENADNLQYYSVTRTEQGETNRIDRIFKDKHIEEMMTIEDYGSEISEIMELASK